MKCRAYAYVFAVGLCANINQMACSEGSAKPSNNASGAGGSAGADSSTGGASGGSDAGGAAAGETSASPPPTRPRTDLGQYADHDQLDADPVLLPIDTDEEFEHRTEIQYLSGKGFDDAVDWDFFCTSGSSNQVWSTIGVPSNWEQYGFGFYNYGRSLTTAEQGKYRRHFSVPASWTGKRISIVFEGAMTDTEVWVNGQSAGTKHQGGFYSFQYDITSLLKPGSDNLLEVTVSKKSANESVNNAERKGDYWVFGGIYRPVMLTAVPEQSIARIAVDARADGHLKVLAVLHELSEHGELTLQLLDENLGPVGAPLVKEVNSGDETVALEGDYPGVERWTAETPHRYRVAVQLATNSGVVHEIRENIGFRTIEVRSGDGIYLNGTRLLLKGVNRHSFWPNTGRALNAALSLYDVRLMRVHRQPQSRVPTRPITSSSMLAELRTLGLEPPHF